MQFTIFDAVVEGMQWEYRIFVQMMAFPSNKCSIGPLYEFHR